MGTKAAGGILHGLDPALGQQVLDEAVDTMIDVKRERSWRRNFCLF
jgi:hypothetical protein